jgi:hypothetical protein
VSTNQVPNGTIQQGQIWTPAQWNAAWQSKVDAVGGFSTNETLTNPAITGATITGGTQASPAINTPAITGGTQSSPVITTPTINGVVVGVPIPTYPQTTAEISASVTPMNFTFPEGNVFRYGAMGNGSADDTAALRSAAAVTKISGNAVFFPAGTGTYKTSNTIAFSSSVFSQGAIKARISCTNLTVPTATLQGANLEVQNITFTHSSAPSAGSGAHGLVLLSGCFQCNVNSCVANFNDMGIQVLTGSSALWLTQNNASNNSSSGFQLQDPNYILEGNISTVNGIHGYAFTTVGQGAGLQAVNNLSFNNGSDGYSFLGTGSSGDGTSIDDALLSNNISSFDGGNGFFFDTHGINLLLSNNYSEFCGFNTSGSVFNSTSVAYSFTANNNGVSVSGCIAYHAASDGLFNGGADITVSGGKYYMNGQGSSGGVGIQGTNAGFTAVTGATIVSNVTIQQSTIAEFASFQNCPGINLAIPPATLPGLTAPAFSGSGSGVTNPFNIPVTVYITSSLVTSVQIKISATTYPAIPSASGFSFYLPAGGTIIPTFTGSPTWVWVGN